MMLLRRVGWTSLFAWACVGLALESAHGLKLASYLDDALTRELCTLAHAHGVGLALVAIVIGGLLFMFGESGAKRQISGIVFGGGLALFATQFLAWLF